MLRKMRSQHAASTEKLRAQGDKRDMKIETVECWRTQF